jgi:hypothetical protein
MRKSRILTRQVIYRAPRDRSPLTGWHLLSLGLALALLVAAAVEVAK